MTATTGLPYWTVRKHTNFTNYVTINDVTSVIISGGRRKLTDLYSAGTGTITGRNPDNLPSLVIGDNIEVGLLINKVGGGQAFSYYEYRVADVIIDYGTTPEYDVWTIEVEDAFAYLGRASLPTTTIASGTPTNTAASTIATAAGLIQYEFGSTTTTTSAQTVTGQNALDVYQTLINTEQAFVTALGNGIRWYARNYWIYNSLFTAFSDDNTAGTNKYTGYVGKTLADNYADQVTVFPRGTSDVVEGSGIFNYNLDSFSFNTQEARFLAQFILAYLSVDFESPTQLNVLVNGQDSTVLDPIQTYPPRVVSVKFRGVTTNNQVIGFRIFGRPEETRYELYLASREFYRFLTLNDATLGKLNENKLGW